MTILIVLMVEEMPNFLCIKLNQKGMNFKLMILVLF